MIFQSLSITACCELLNDGPVENGRGVGRGPSGLLPGLTWASIDRPSSTHDGFLDAVLKSTFRLNDADGDEDGRGRARGGLGRVRVWSERADGRTAMFDCWTKQGMRLTAT